jgi:hypothetical protein
MLNVTSNYSLPNDFRVSYYYYYVHPIFSIFATFQSLICTIVLSQKELRRSGAFFQYSLVNSAGGIVGCFILVFFFFTRCNSLCSASNSYWSQAYEIYAVYYVDGSLLLASSLIQIAISFKLYLTVTQRLKRINSVSPYKVVFVSLGNYRF